MKSLNFAGVSALVAVEHEYLIGNQLPHEMIADINMSNSLMINRVFGQRNGIYIIIMNSRGTVQLLV